MKRYLLFCGDKYYPFGGWGDWGGEYDTLQEAKESLMGRQYDWYHIVDTETGEYVADNR